MPFPSIRDLVTDVSWNFRVKKTIKKFKPRSPDAPDGTWRMQQADVDRVQEFRKCIECFLCQDVCHVLREHHKHDEFIGPRFLVYAAALEMHPLDTEDRVSDLKTQAQHRLLQHHDLLPAGVSGIDYHYRERDYSAERTGGRPVLRSAEEIVPYPLMKGGPMFALKPISHDSVAGALGEAERYRLLNEPSEAESICRDILEIDPGNRQARISADPGT